jgi:hypothetical protein
MSGSVMNLDRLQTDPSFPLAASSSGGHVPRSRGRVRRYPIRLAALPSVISCLALALGAVACNPDDEPVGPDEKPLTGGIRGRVTSSLFGPLANALVTVTPGGQTATSDRPGTT